MIELGVTPTMIQPVILCGGSGTRLWPLSREHHPKPLHALNGERTLLQDTARRCRGVAAIGEPLVVCNEAHRFMVQAQLARIGALAELIAPGRNGLLFEPGSPRDLARRLAWADAFPEKMRQMGECARADYQARFMSDWGYQKLFGERRRSARV